MYEYTQKANSWVKSFISRLTQTEWNVFAICLWLGITHKFYAKLFGHNGPPLQLFAISLQIFPSRKEVAVLFTQCVTQPQDQAVFFSQFSVEESTVSKPESSASQSLLTTWYPFYVWFPATLSTSWKWKIKLKDHWRRPSTDHRGTGTKEVRGLPVRNLKAAAVLKTVQMLWGNNHEWDISHILMWERFGFLAYSQKFLITFHISNINTVIAAGWFSRTGLWWVNQVSPEALIQRYKSVL